MARSELLIGTLGWSYDAWSGPFFPEDLPVEWRLTYYANEYPVVLVSHRAWMTASPTTVEEWIDDVPGAFQFFLDASPQGCESSEAQERLVACVTALGSYCGGVLTAQHALETLDQKVGDDVLIYSRRASADTGSLLYTAAPERAQVLVWDSRQLPDLLGRRTVLERLIAESAPGREAVLFLAGEPPSLEKVDETRTLAELLGFA